MINRRRVVAALVVLLAAVSVGCNKSAKSGEADTGILTGYELGNQQDFADQRRERPGYRDFD
jgi:hypothetical protein